MSASRDGATPQLLPVPGLPAAPGVIQRTAGCLCDAALDGGEAGGGGCVSPRCGRVVSAEAGLSATVTHWTEESVTYREQILPQKIGQIDNECGKSDLKKFLICAISGQSDPLLAQI